MRFNWKQIRVNFDFRLYEGSNQLLLWKVHQILGFKNRDINRSKSSIENGKPGFDIEGEWYASLKTSRPCLVNLTCSSTFNCFEYRTCSLTFKIGEQGSTCLQGLLTLRCVDNSEAYSCLQVWVLYICARKGPWSFIFFCRLLLSHFEAFRM